MIRDKLLRDNFVAYVAARKELHLWRRNERRMVEVVLIPCIVFVKTQESSLLQLIKNYNFNGFMRNNAQKSEQGKVPYAIVSDAEMRLLKVMLGQDEFDVSFVPSQFTLGEHVRILGFETGDHLPQIVHIPGDNKTYVGVRVDFLGCAYMQVPISRIVRLGAPSRKG